jgi:hypothetical protein
MAWTRADGWMTPDYLYARGDRCIWIEYREIPGPSPSSSRERFAEDIHVH